MDVGELQDVALAYLRALGFQPVVIGPVLIQHQPGERQYNHELVIRFTSVIPPGHVT